MLPRRRSVTLAALIALIGAAGAASAAPQSEQLERHKINAVRSVLSGQEAQLADMTHAVTQADALLGLDMRADASGAVLTIKTTGKPEVRTFFFGGNRRLVIDVKDTVNLKAGHTLRPEGPCPVAKVRTSLFSVKPRIVSRTVIDLDRPCTYSCDQTEGKITVTLTGQQAPHADPLAALTDELSKLRKSVPLNNETAAKHALIQPPRPLATATPVALAASPTVPIPTPKDGLLATTAPPTIILSSTTALAAPAEIAPQNAAAEDPNLLAQAFQSLLAQNTPAAVPAGESPSPEPETPVAAEAQAEVVTEAEVQPEPAEAPQDEPEAEMITEAVTAPVVEALAPAPVETVEELIVEPAPELPTRAELLAMGIDPLTQPVTIDFREMELSNVVALLAQKAGINVIAGTEVSGVISANLREVPLIRALEMLLRLNGLGIVEEAGIFRIIPYADAQAEHRVSKVVSLKNAKAADIQSTLDSALAGAVDATVTSVASNESTNTIILTGPQDRIDELERLCMQLDVGEPPKPTVTEAIPLDYAEPDELMTSIETLMTPEIGQVAADSRSRTIIITDYPIVVEQVRDIIASLDLPVKQVAIESMVVEAFLEDSAQTGIDWLVDAVNRRSSYGTGQVNQGPNTGHVNSGQATDSWGTPLRVIDPATLQSGALPAGQLLHQVTGTFDDLTTGSTLGANAAAPLAITFSMLSNDFDISGLISAEAQSSNISILSNPTIVTIENKEAHISIVREIPYRETTETEAGGSLASTEFKEIGVTLTVTPRVTNSNDIIVDFTVKESNVDSTLPAVNNIPVENRREAAATLRMGDGQTIFIGGLRKADEDLVVAKVPILGDIPVMNFLFRNTNSVQRNTELLTFLTCTVLGDTLPDLTDAMQDKYDTLENTPKVPNAQKTLFNSLAHPEEMRDPFWKWRRSEEE
jgi:type II secretory pathway component GspD/PulD (secretin)